MQTDYKWDETIQDYINWKKTVKKKRKDKSELRDVESRFVART